MRKSILIPVLFSLTACAQNVSYNDSILQYRQHYKQEFLEDERSPLTAPDTGFLRFYAPDETYRVAASLELTPNTKPFDMPTASGKSKPFKQYGVLKFTLNDTSMSLPVYQNLKLKKDPKHKYHLFLPFRDKTSNEQTYGGGRYIDLSIKDIDDNGMIEVDFNKCYNPWCAYGTGYSCPIPPKENRIPVAVKAGEMNFGKETEH